MYAISLCHISFWNIRVIPLASFDQDRCGVTSFAAKFFMQIYGINSYCSSRHNLLLPVSDSFRTYNYGFVFHMARTIGLVFNTVRAIRFLRSDNFTVLRHFFGRIATHEFTR